MIRQAQFHRNLREPVFSYRGLLLPVGPLLP